MPSADDWKKLIKKLARKYDAFIHDALIKHIPRLLGLV